MDDFSVEELVFLIVMFIENNVVDFQFILESLEFDFNYVYKYVFRDVFISVVGNLIQDEVIVGSFVQQFFVIIFKEKYKVDDCLIIVFVYLGGDMKVVLQVEKEGWQVCFCRKC